MKKVLIVVDFQKDFVDGSLGFSKATQLDKVIYDKITTYMQENQDVIFTLDTHDKDYMETREGKNLPILHCQKDSLGWEIYGKVNKLYKDNSEKYKTFIKSAYGSIELAEYLKNTDYEQVEVVGLVTNICVMSNAVIVQAALPNAHIIIDAKATACADDDLYNKTLDVLESVNMQIINRD